MRLLITWLVNALALLALPYIFPSIQVDSFVTALVAALVLGLINTLIRPLLVLLTLPVTLLTLGLFIFVINGLLFWFVGSFVQVSRRRLLGRRLRRDRLQPDFLGAVGADPEPQRVSVQRPQYSLDSSAPHRRRRSEASCGTRRVREAAARVLLGDVRCRWFDAGGDARHGARDPRGRHGRRAAHFIHRQHA